MPTDWRDHEERAVPFNDVIVEETGVNTGGGHNAPGLSGYAVAAYRSTAVTVDPGGADCVVEVGWTMDGGSGAVAVETKTVTASKPQTLLFVNQGHLLDHVKLTGGAGVNYSVTESNQLPLPPSATPAGGALNFLQLENSGGGQTIPTGNVATLVDFDGPIGSEWGAYASNFAQDTPGGFPPKINGLHALVPGVFLVIAQGTWNANVVGDKTLWLRTVINSLSFSQTDVAQTFTDANETSNTLSTLLWVPTDMVGNPGNTIQLYAFQNTGAGLNLIGVRLLVAQLLASAPWDVTP